MKPLFEPNQDLLQLTRAIEPWIIEKRRYLHQCPEIMFELHETSQYVSDVLNELGVTHRRGVAKTGIVATIGEGDADCVMLRADMDALPIEEASDVDFKSRNPGCMHACGHDCHTAMLLGAAKLLKERESDLPGPVKLCFQPAEEGDAGAKMMCDEGVMTSPDVTRTFGLHVWPGIPTGTLTGRPGVFLSAKNNFEICITGKGGHAAMPHKCIDPVASAAKMITALQSLVSREKDPLTPGVITFTAIDSAQSFNVIPSEVRIKGTVRALTTKHMTEMKDRLAAAAVSMAELDRCEAEFTTVSEDYPATVNDPQLWERVFRMGQKLVGEDSFEICDPTMGAEDFSFYGLKSPACIVALGCGNEAKGCVNALHHPEFKVDEDALHIGTAMHLAFVSEHFEG